MTGDEGAVLRLVEVEAGLVARARSDAEAAAALGDHELGPCGVLARLEALEARRRRLVEPLDAAAGKELGERPRDPVGGAEHAERQALDDAQGAVAVHDEPGQPVRLAPAEAVGVGDQAGRPAVLPGGLEPAPEELRVDGFVTPREQAAAERRARVVEALAEITAARSPAPRRRRRPRRSP